MTLLDNDVDTTAAFFNHGHKHVVIVFDVFGSRTTESHMGYDSKGQGRKTQM